MSFFTPSAAWLLLLAGPLIALYFLKLKRPRVTVPSLVLWRRVLDDQRVNSPFQRFKRNLLLLLQLLLLAFLVLAAMQPFFSGGEERVSRLPVLIDCSASMAGAAERAGESRLAEAKEEVENLIAGLLPDQELALISFARDARQRCGFTGDRSRLREALEEIGIEEVPSEIEPALQMARALGRTSRVDEVLVLTDGNVPDEADLDLSFRVNFQRIDPAGPNIGITACTARRIGEAGWEIYVEVGGSVGGDYGGAVTMSEVKAGRNDPPLASELVTTRAGQSTRLLFQTGGQEARDLRFELIPNSDFDALESDNAAFLSLPALRPVGIHVAETLVSFRHALRAVEGVEVYPRPGVATPESFDLVIADQPEDAGRSASVRLWISMVPDSLADVLRVEKPSSHQAIDWRRDEPLLQHVDLSNVVFLDEPVASEVEEGVFVSRGFEVLVFGARGPLLLRESRLADETVVFHALFDFDRSTFPYRVGFPVLVSNLVGMARESAGLAEVRAWPTGRLRAEETTTAGGDLRVRTPAGKWMAVDTDQAGLPVGVEATEVGLYHYERGGDDWWRGASLVSPQETALEVVETVRFRETESETEGSTLGVDRPLWRWALLAALALLLLEWYVFQGRPGRAAAGVSG